MASGHRLAYFTSYQRREDGSGRVHRPTSRLSSLGGLAYTLSAALADASTPSAIATTPTFVLVVVPMVMPMVLVLMEEVWLLPWPWLWPWLPWLRFWLRPRRRLRRSWRGWWSDLYFEGTDVTLGDLGPTNSSLVGG
jgi:hypothetical protein